MVNCTQLSKETFLKLLDFNEGFKKCISSSTSWDEITEYLDSIGIKYTEEQILYIREHLWDNDGELDKI